MDKEQAKKLVKETFENNFNKELFLNFIRNLCNEIDESKAFPVRETGYIKEAFLPYVKTYERLGTYTDTEEKKIDILIVYLQKENSIERARTAQRNFVARYLQKRGEKDAALVAFVSPSNDDWRFSLIKMDYRFEQTENGKIKIKDEFTPARRWSFLVGKNESSHTAQSRFTPIVGDDENPPTLSMLEAAFDIETVTKEFYAKYYALFTELNARLDDILKTNEKVKEEFKAKNIDTSNFTEKLLGQIVFLYFLQKKGWFGVGRNESWGTGPKDFLRRLFEKKMININYENFFNDILEPLFYEALAQQRDYNFYSRFNCKIPFLNGGLFDPINNYDWVHIDILLPNELFSNQTATKEGDKGNGILDIFDRYNFTVKEDEPLEKEVAVDPEMLGKVFENLLESNDRKTQGTFYTPREIVHYMCQESLVSYLSAGLEDNVEKNDISKFIKIGELVGEHEAAVILKEKETKDYSHKIPESIRANAKQIDEKLASIKVCDPACGSGAFLVGMMSEIVKARNILSIFMEGGGDRSLYNFKRECIENSLYGVDINAGAVEIAKLRLWLSLIVDEEDIEQIKPLPNLDYKIVRGNSLLGIDLNADLNLFNKESFDEIERYKNSIIEEINHEKKKDLKKKIDELILNITDGKKDFDFEIYFSEVFRNNGGFDVVIANPPYIRADSSAIKQQREIIKKSNTYETLWEKWDLYVAFIEKGYQILTPNGILEFIISDAYMASKYAIKSHDYFLKNAAINRIDFCSELKIFDAAIRNIIIEYKKKINPNNIPLRIKHVKEWNNFIFLPSKKQSEMSENTFKLNSEGKTIGDLSNTVTWKEICYVSVGLVLNAEERLYQGEFSKDDLISEKEDEIHSKRYIEAKWTIKYRIEKIKFLEWNTDRVPKKIRRPTFSELYVPDKIMVGRMTGAIYDNTGLLCNDSIIVSVLWKDIKDVQNRSIEGSIKKDFKIKKIYPFRNQLEENSKCFNLKYLLAILNSKFAYKFLDSARRSQIGFYPDDFKKLPIKKISGSGQEPFIELTDKILAITKDDDYPQNLQKQSQVKTIENRIDELVYKLYNLTDEEIKIVEGITDNY